MRISDWSSDVCSSDLMGREKMRRLTALLLAAGLPFAVTAQGAASEATRAAQAELAKRLPLDDPRDEANATRGKIAENPHGLIQTADEIGRASVRERGSQ